MSISDLRIQEVQSRRQLKQFVTFPWQIYRGDPNWVPPLLSRRLAYFDRTRSAFFQEGDAALFLALRNDRTCLLYTSDAADK